MNKRTIIILFVVVVAGLCALHIAFVSRPNQKALNMLGEASSIIEKAKSLTSYTEILAQYEQACVLIDSVLREHPNSKASLDLKNGNILIGGYKLEPLLALRAVITQRANAEKDPLECIATLAQYKDMQGWREEILEQCAILYNLRGEKEKAQNIVSSGLVNHDRYILELGLRYIKEGRFEEAANLIAANCHLFQTQRVLYDIPAEYGERLIEPYIAYFRKEKNYNSYDLERLADYCYYNSFLKQHDEIVRLFYGNKERASMQIRNARVSYRNGDKQSADKSIAAALDVVQSESSDIKDKIYSDLSRYYYEFDMKDKAIEAILSMRNIGKRVIELYTLSNSYYEKKKYAESDEVFSIAESNFIQYWEDIAKNERRYRIAEMCIEMGKLDSASKVLSTYDTIQYEDLSNHEYIRALRVIMLFNAMTGKFDNMLDMAQMLIKFEKGYSLEGFLNDVALYAARAGKPIIATSIIKCMDDRRINDGIGIVAYELTKAGYEKEAFALASNDDFSLSYMYVYAGVALAYIISGEDEKADNLLNMREEVRLGYDDIIECAANVYEKDVVIHPEICDRLYKFVSDREYNKQTGSEFEYRLDWIGYHWARLGQVDKALEMVDTIKEKHEAGSLMFYISAVYRRKNDDENARLFFNKGIEFLLEEPDLLKAVRRLVYRLDDIPKGVQTDKITDLIRRAIPLMWRNEESKQDRSRIISLAQGTVELEQWDLLLMLLMKWKDIEEFSMYDSKISTIPRFVRLTAYYIPHDYKPEEQVIEGMQKLFREAIPAASIWNPYILRVESDSEKEPYASFYGEDWRWQ